MQYPESIPLHKYQAPLHIGCGYSQQLLLLVTGIGVFSCGMIIILTGFYSTWFVAGLPVLILHVRQIYRCHVSRTSSGAVTELHRGSDGDWQIHYQSGEIEQALLLGSSIVLPLMMILRFRRIGSRHIHIVVLMPDALGKDKYRRTCMQLLTERTVITAQ